MQGAPPTLTPALRKLLEHAYQSRERQVRRIIDDCRQRFPHYGALSGDALTSLRDNADQAVGAFYLHGLIEGQLPTAEDLEVKREAARARVAQGVPLNELLGSYHVGPLLLWADLVSRVSSKREAQVELFQRVPVTIAATALITGAATEAYVEERERLMPSRDQAVAELLRLLAGDEAPPAVLETRADALGLELDAPRFAALFRPPRGQATSVLAVDFVRGLFDERRLADDLLVGRIAVGVLAIFPQEAERGALADIAGKLRGRGWRAGVGGVGSGTAGLRRTIREAARAVELGVILDRKGPLEEYHNLAVLDLVDIGSPRAVEFARRVLGPLAHSGVDSKHLQTLRALCRSGFSRKLAAASLEIHPHTLSYRLSQIRRRYGIDLEDPETRLRVHLAVLIVGV